MQASYLVAFGVMLALLSNLPQGHLECPSDSLALYHVVMKTHWSVSEFPRHYPGFGFRPSAQWSRLIGRTHNSSYTLFRIGEMASAGLKKFAETASSDTLDEMNSTGAFDAFSAPPIVSGEGLTHTNYFVDGSHSKLSLASKVIPSPDWFVGISDYDMCNNDRWIDSVMIELDPLDAGTDNGYTFSAPNWATVPPEAIYNIHSVKLHHAHSFYRESRSERPKPIATLTIHKLKEYSLSALRGSGSDADSGLASVHHHILDDIEQNDIANELNQLQFSELTDEHNMTPRAAKRKRSRKMRGSRSSRDCTVSDWSDWSECSALCGFGEQRRNRYIASHPRGGGVLCPPLSEKRLCNSARECRDNYFDW